MVSPSSDNNLKLKEKFYDRQVSPRIFCCINLKTVSETERYKEKNGMERNVAFATLNKKKDRSYWLLS